MHFHLPSDSPYRRRYGDWETALQHFGFTSDQLAERLARAAKVVPPPPPAEKPTPDGLPIATLVDDLPQQLPVPSEQAAAIRDAYNALPPRTRYILTVRLGLGGAETRTLRETAKPLSLYLARIRVLQHDTVGDLAASAGTTSRTDVVETLRALAAPLT